MTGHTKLTKINFYFGDHLDLSHDVLKLHATLSFIMNSVSDNGLMCVIYTAFRLASQYLHYASNGTKQFI